jgi:hypothetical protein
MQCIFLIRENIFTTNYWIKAFVHYANMSQIEQNFLMVANTSTSTLNIWWWFMVAVDAVYAEASVMSALCEEAVLEGDHAWKCGERGRVQEKSLWNSRNTTECSSEHFLQLLDISNPGLMKQYFIQGSSQTEGEARCLCKALERDWGLLLM